MNGFEELVGLAAGRALNALPLSLLIALFAWLIQRSLGRESSAVRFSVWFASLIAITALPFVPRLGSTSTGESFHSGIALPNSWAVSVVVGWGVFALIGAMHLSVGLWKLHRLRRRCVPIDVGGMPVRLRETVEQCRAARPVEICMSPEVRVPTVIGFFRPAILFPEWTWSELPQEDLRAVILHEFAHLERRDDWTNLVQKVIGALLFFHPVVWWIERRLSVEREVACDELVLAKTGNPQAYARCLISLAEKGLVRRSLAMAQAAVSHARDLSARLARILSPRQPVPDRGFKPGLSFAAIGAVICAVAVAGAPEFVTFEQPAQSQILASFARTSTAQIGSSETAAISGAQVVPAKLTMAKEVKSPARTKLVPAKLIREDSERVRPIKTAGRHSRPQPQPESTTPAVINASARDIAPSPQFLVLTQTTQFDEFGGARVSFTLWKVTMPNGTQSVPRAEVIARSL